MTKYFMQTQLEIPLYIDWGREEKTYGKALKVRYFDSPGFIEGKRRFMLKEKLFLLYFLLISAINISWYIETDAQHRHSRYLNFIAINNKAPQRKCTEFQCSNSIKPNQSEMSLSIVKYEKHLKKSLEAQNIIFCILPIQVAFRKSMLLQLVLKLQTC